MNYVIPDIHNDNRRLKELLKKIGFGTSDHLYLLGDLFDRCEDEPDPVGVYFTILNIIDQCSIVTGNHDIWLSSYIENYYGTKERKRNKLKEYEYNSFSLMKKRLTEVDMINLAKWIKSLPLQREVALNGKKYLFAHAMTSDPKIVREDRFYLFGENDEAYYRNGIEGYISFLGHSNSSFFSIFGGSFMDNGPYSVWRNEKENVYMMDCGCGFVSGRLSCICLETMKCVYV